MLKPSTRPATIADLRQFFFTQLSRRARLRLVLAVTVTLLLLLQLLLPYDSAIRSFFRFHGHNLNDYIHSNDDWVNVPRKYSVNIEEDVGIIIKTGYGTRERVPELLTALGKAGLNADMVVLQDYPVNQEERYKLPSGVNVPAVDIIGWMLEKNLVPEPDKQGRIIKYRNLVGAIEAQKYKSAATLGKQFGWELDAMKFISGLQYTHQHLPKKSWYLILDDDSYPILPSILLLLSHLDPLKPHYIGNAVGAYSSRFAHGGSSFILSGAALSLLFDQNPKVVASAHAEAMTTTWGDGLMATTLMKVGVYLDESYTLWFNGEPPRDTRMWAERFCLPLVSMHGLREPGAMAEVGALFADVTTPVLWHELGAMLGAPDPEDFVEHAGSANHSYVGRLDEHSTTLEGIKGWQHCLEECISRRETCLAWTWEIGKKLCHVAPWYVVGNPQENALSGVNGELVMFLERKCDNLMEKRRGADVMCSSKDGGSSCRPHS